MTFDAYAVESRWGPHVTLQAATVHLGRHWTTTTRRSAKALAVGRTGRASATSLRADGSLRVVAGRARVLDPSRPASLLGDLRGVALGTGALARLIAGQIDQVAGYAEAGPAVPAAWLPWGRVVLAADLDHRLEVDRRGRLRLDRWPTSVPGAAPTRPEHRPWGVPTGVPGAARSLVERPGPCWVGVVTPAGVVALPGTWDPTAAVVAVDAEVAGAVGAQLPGPACVTFDESRERRPDRKAGCMLRGALDADGAVVAERVTWWVGFASGTERVFDSSATFGA